MDFRFWRDSLKQHGRHQMLRILSDASATVMVGDSDEPVPVTGADRVLIRAVLSGLDIEKLQILLELAESGVLSERDADSEELRNERARQQQVIAYFQRLLNELG